MKIACEKNLLTKALSMTEKIVGINPTLPVLSCVLLRTRKNSLLIQATNLELGIEVVVPAKSNEDGVLAVPGVIFSNTIQNTHDSSIELEMEKDALVIQTKHSRTLLKTHPHDDFPSLPVVQGGSIHTLKSNDIVEGIQSVGYSASRSHIKPELSSVYVYERDKKLYFVATDSFRLAEKVIHTKQKNTLEAPFLLPLRNALEIVRILSQLPDSDVIVKVGDNQISFECGDVFITSRIIDGTFPDYRQIIPKDHISEVTALKQDLLNVFKKINIFSDKFGQVSVLVEPKKKSFVLSAQSGSIGETRDAIDAIIKGESVDMRFNYRYIYDCLSSIHSDSINLLFTGIGKPLIIKGVSDESFLYIVMPMNK